MSLGEIEQHALAISEREIVGAEIVHLPHEDAPCYAVVGLWPDCDQRLHYAGNNFHDAQQVCAEVNAAILRSPRT